MLAKKEIEKNIEDGGLIVNVFKTNRDCTNGGVTSGLSEAYIFNAKNLEGSERVRSGHVSFGDIHPNDHDKVLVIVDSNLRGFVRAVPLLEWLAGRWTMMGGNFVHTSDSRFPVYPLPVHDRVEE